MRSKKDEDDELLGDLLGNENLIEGVDGKDKENDDTKEKKESEMEAYIELLNDEMEEMKAQLLKEKTARLTIQDKTAQGCKQHLEKWRK